MYLYIYAIVAFSYLLYYVAHRLKPSFSEWIFFLFLIVLAQTPRRVYGMFWYPGQQTTSNVLFIWLFLFVFLVRWVLSGRPLSRRELTILICLTLFVMWSAFSAVLSGNSDFISLWFTAIRIWVPSFLVCFFGLSGIRKTPRSAWRLEMFYVTLSAVAIAPPLILTAMNLGGWEHIANSESGFVRGWSPIGSGISTGAVILPAFFFCMRRFFLGQHRIRNVLIMTIISIAILFTLARSIMLLLLLGSLLMMLCYSARSKKQMVYLSCFGVLFLAILSPTMMRFSFGRLTSLGGASNVLRAKSLRIAFEAGLRSPIWGRGFGCLYSDIRNEIRGDSTTLTIDGQISLWEPHNLYAFCWAEMGMGGVIVLLALFASFYQPLRKQCWRRYKKPPDFKCHKIVFFVITLFFCTGSGWLLYPTSSVFFSFILLIPFYCGEHLIRCRKKPRLLHMRAVPESVNAATMVPV